jgi:hypothetical protein
VIEARDESEYAEGGRTTAELNAVVAGSLDQVCEARSAVYAEASELGFRACRKVGELLLDVGFRDVLLVGDEEKRPLP